MARAGVELGPCWAATACTPQGDHTLCLMCPRIVLPAPPQVRWITFHSGYDFGYLLKLLTCQSLPANEGEFFQLLKVRRHHRAGC